MKKVLHGPKWSLETCRARTSYIENVYLGTVDDVDENRLSSFVKQELEVRRNKKIGERNLQQ